MDTNITIRSWDLFFVKNYRFDHKKNEFDYKESLALVVEINNKWILALPITSRQNFTQNTSVVPIQIPNGIVSKVFFKDIYTEPFSNLIRKIGCISRDELKEIIAHTTKYLSACDGKYHGWPARSHTVNNVENFIHEHQEKIQENERLNRLYKSQISLAQLTKDLIDRASYYTIRKNTLAIENIYNDSFCDFLRDKWYRVADQARCGSSQSGGWPGSLDIMIFDGDNLPNNIIEAFRLSVFDRTIIHDHIYKLINSYDTLGNPRNYIIVYAESPNFSDLWEKYKKYISENLDSFHGSFFYENSHEFTDKADIKTAILKYERNEKQLDIFHIFINMYRK